MAIVASTGQGDVKLYDIPDDQLSQYEMEQEELSDSSRGELFGGSDNPGRDKAEGVLAPGSMGQPEVQAYSNYCICWVRRGRRYYWWYCPC
jgi:hypothetical protein